MAFTFRAVFEGKLFGLRLNWRGFCCLRFAVLAICASVVVSPSNVMAEIASAHAPYVIDSSDVATLRACVGRMVTVAGRVAAVTSSPNGERIHLHFDRVFEGPLSLVLAVKNRWPKKNAMQIFIGKRIEVSGNVVYSNGLLELQAVEPAHIELLRDR